MKSFICMVAMVMLFGLKANAQGCVAIRSVGGMCTMDHAENHDTIPAKWTMNINTRYFNSFRHFVGTEEQKQRIAQGTQVINHSMAIDLSAVRILNKRWSLGVNLPIISNTRSSLYEHGGAARHSTSSFGMGDMRFTVYHWLTNPDKMKKFSLQAGLGIKLPTGDYKVQDYFYTSTGTRVLGPVDQSIQLGDGGTGFTGELNAFYTLSRKVSLYGNLFYLLNPREHNGVSTARGGTPSATAVLYGSDVMSVPDQYMIRFGANFTFNKLTLSAGFRDECVPASDLINGSYGFRRPGYVYSIEPGITYAVKKVNLYAYVPFAIKRDRTQSYADKQRTTITGVYAQGDAAFADLAVNIGMSVRF
jgi:hypothetical protein